MLKDMAYALVLFSMHAISEALGSRKLTWINWSC